MVNNKLISVIVPFYRTPREQFEACINSLIMQSYKNIEILIVDDASGKEWLPLLQETEKKDQRIKVIHQAINKGLSEARNFGLQMCSGEDVVFMDSDDMFHHAAIQTMYDAKKRTNSDLVIGGLCITNTYHTEEKNIENYKYYIYPTEEALERMITNSGFGATACGRLASKKLWTAGGMEPFIAGLIHEDLASTWKVVCDCKRICWIDENIYFYYQGEQSAIHSKEVSEKFCRDYIFALKNRNKGVIKKYPHLKAVTDLSNLMHCPNIYMYANEITNSKTAMNIKEEVMDIFKSSYRSGLNYNSISKKQIIKAVLFEKCPNIYCQVYKVIRKIKGLRY